MKILAMAGMLACAMAIAAQEALAAEPVSLGNAIRGTAAELSPGIDRGASVAVIAVQADSVGMSDHLINELIAALFDLRGARGFEVVSRSHIELLMAEQELSMSGLVDDASAVSIGRFAGAQFIITGAFSPFGDSYRFVAQMLQVETGFFRGISTADVQNDSAVSALLGAAGRAPPRPVRPRSVNWLSVEGSLLGLGARYERDVSEFFSVGVVGWFDVNLWDPEEDIQSFGFLAAARFFPLNLTGLFSNGFPVYIELGMGVGHVQWLGRNGESFASGLMVSPAIGARLGGQRRGFFVNPFVSLSVVFGQREWRNDGRWTEGRPDRPDGNITTHFRFGIGLGWAW